MYDSFYGLKDRPFSMLPDPGFLYLSKKHQMALTMLEYALYNNAGFCIISGEIGAGKTTLLRKLLESMEDHISVGMITNTHSSFGELLDWVLSAFNIHQPGMNKVEMHQIFLEYLLQQYSKKKTVVLIVDEAQNMSVDTLEELRMLSNINTGKDQLLQVILAGQPELKDTLRLPELKQFAQRIAVDYHLGALSIEETFGYIRHRLKTAGATKDIFSPLACERIHLYSGGVPRLINLLCDTALVYGFADQAEVIDENLVEEMVRERMSDSLVPIVHPVAAETESPAPSAAGSDSSARGTATPPSKLSQISPEHKKQPVSPTAEKKTVADIRQPVSIHPQAQASGARLQAVAAQPELDPEEQEEAVPETALASEPEIAPEISPDSVVEPEAETETDSEPVAETSAEQAETAAPSSQPSKPETVKQRLENKIEVLKIVASEPESSWFGNKWTMIALLVLGLSVIFLLVRSMSADSVSSPVKAEASAVSGPTAAPATSSSASSVTTAQPAVDNSAATARQKAIEAARQAAEKREAEAKAKAEAEAAAKAKAEAEAKAKAEQAAAARRAERARAAAKARAAELEAKLKAEQAAAARAREQAAAAEEKARQAQAQALEMQQKAQASSTSTTSAMTTSSVAASAKPTNSGAQNVDPELEFTTDPCQGPSARFLSTCRK